MANNAFVKPEQVINQMLGVLARDTLLAQLVWRDPIPSFKGAKDDTVSIRIPAYTTARTRQMRSNTAITVDKLTETKVPMTLDTHVYKAIGVSDEEMTLDIVDFGAQVTAPSMSSVVREVDDELAAEMADADYAVDDITLPEDDPYLGLVDARTALGLANVPYTQRFLAVGANVEAAILKSNRLSKFDSAGPDVNQALRDAAIGKIAGFIAVPVPGLDPDIAVAGHQTAFALSLVPPVLPDGVEWGALAIWKGMGLRTLKDYDPTPAAGGPPQDRLLVDTFMGTATVKDRGTINGDTGRFEPSVDGTDDPILVRAVKCTLTRGS